MALGGDSPPFPHLLLVNHPELPNTERQPLTLTFSFTQPLGQPGLEHPLPQVPIERMLAFVTFTRERHILPVQPTRRSVFLPPSVQGPIPEILSLWNGSIQPGDSKHFKEQETALVVQLAGKV